MKKTTRRILSALLFVMMLVTVIGGSIQPVKAATNRYRVCEDILNKSTQIPNGFTNVSRDISQGSPELSFGGWVLSDETIAAYNFTFVGAGFSRSNLTDFQATDRVSFDSGLAQLRKSTGIGKKAKTQNTGYSGTLQIGKLTPGSYTFVLTATTVNGTSFTVLKISFKIIGTNNNTTTTSKFLYCIDEPANSLGPRTASSSISLIKNPIENTLKLRAWCVCDEGVKEYRIAVNGTEKTVYGYTRPDSAAIIKTANAKGIGKNDDKANHGLEYNLDISKLEKGKVYTAVIYAITKKGTKIRLAGIDFKTKPAPTSIQKTITYITGVEVVNQSNVQKFSSTDEEIFITPPAVTKPFYYCYEYCTTKDGTGKRYRKGEPYYQEDFPETNTTLYPVWITVGSPLPYYDIPEDMLCSSDSNADNRGKFYTNCLWYSLGQYHVPQSSQTIPKSQKTFGTYEGEIYDKLLKAAGDMQASPITVTAYNYDISVDNAVTAGPTYSIRPIENEKAPIESNEYRICMRYYSTNTGLKYHFWRQTSDGKWCCKIGYYEETTIHDTYFPSDVTWSYTKIDEKTNKSTTVKYTSSTYYFAVKKSK